jgi:hypothetical protein
MWRPSKLVIPFIDYDLGNKFSVGVNLSNIGPKISYIDRDQADPLPMNFRLGLAWRLFADDFNSLTYTLDFSKLLVAKHSDGTSDEFYEALFSAWGDDPFGEELADIVTTMGMEYWYGEPGDFLFALRMGYFYEDPNHGNRKFLTFGAGIRYDIYGFDFSYISTSVFEDGENHPLSDTLRFTILVGWGGAVESNRSLPRGI